MTSPRIIGGKARGHRLQSVPGDTTRPITDMVKEALFNILGQDIIDATLLDVFGGTGSVGIEALSRGASFVQFLDLNHRAVDTIKKNLTSTRLEAFGNVQRADAFVYLKQPPTRQFDYIFIAPPQYKGMWIQAMSILNGNSKWLMDDGCIIVQIDPIEYMQLDLIRFIEVDQRKYGNTILVFYEINPGPQTE